MGVPSSQTLSKKASELVELVFQRAWEEEIGLIKKTEVVSASKRTELENKIDHLTEKMVSAKNEKMQRVYEKQIEKAVEQLEVLDSVQSVDSLDMSVPYRTALQKTIGLLQNPYKVWSELDVIEKQRLFFFIFDEKLSYSKISGYRTANLPCAVRLFEEFAQAKSQDVEDFVPS